MTDYNKYNYYRANPYSKQGFLPPRAKKNRTNANYLSNLPQGSQDFINNRRKHFRARSNIDQYQIFDHDGSPMNKHKSIQIQGSTSSPLNSVTLKNKYMAQKQISKRQKQMENYQTIKRQKQIQQENIKKSIQNQYKQNKHMFNLISGRHMNDYSVKRKSQEQRFEYPNQRTQFQKKIFEKEKNLNYSNQIEYKKQNPQISKRRNNPTYLSSQNSFLMVGKNLVNN